MNENTHIISMISHYMTLKKIIFVNLAFYGISVLQKIPFFDMHELKKYIFKE